MAFYAVFTKMQIDRSPLAPVFCMLPFALWMVLLAELGVMIPCNRALDNDLSCNPSFFVWIYRINILIFCIAIACLAVRYKFNYIKPSVELMAHGLFAEWMFVVLWRANEAQVDPLRHDAERIIMGSVCSAVWFCFMVAEAMGFYCGHFAKRNKDTI